MILITVWGPLKFCAHGECLTLLTPVTAPCVTPGTTHTIAVASKPQSPGAAESSPVPRPVFCTCAVCPSGRARGRPGHPEGGAGLGRSSVHSGSLDEMKLPLTSSSLCPEINLPSESLSRWTESSFLFLGHVSGWAGRGGLGALHRGFKQTRESRGRGQPRRACVHVSLRCFLQTGCELLSSSEGALGTAGGTWGGELHRPFCRRGPAIPGGLPSGKQAKECARGSDLQQDQGPGICTYKSLLLPQGAGFPACSTLGTRTKFFSASFSPFLLPPLSSENGEDGEKGNLQNKVKTAVQ